MIYNANVMQTDIFGSEDIKVSKLEGVVGQQVGQGGVVSLLFYNGKVRLMNIPIDGYIELVEVKEEELKDCSEDLQAWYKAKVVAVRERAEAEAKEAKANTES